jgi:hypothetical protein
MTKIVLRLAAFAFGLGVALTGCGTVGSPPAQTDPKVMARIVNICMSSGLFKFTDGVVATLVPVAALPIALVNAGVDQVCTHPETFAADATTVEWLVKNLVVRRHDVQPIQAK